LTRDLSGLTTQAHGKTRTETTADGAGTPDDATGGEGGRLAPPTQKRPAGPRSTGAASEAPSAAKRPRQCGPRHTL